VIADWGIAVCAACVLVLAGLSTEQAADVPALGYVLLATGGLVLAGRRRAPVTVLVVTGLCVLGYQAAGFDVPALAFLVAVYSAVRAGHHTVTVAAGLLVLAGVALGAFVSGPQDPGAAFAHARDVLELAWLIAAGAAGEALRQAERRADEAERSREETARRRADEERLHIARELHDSLTHQISVIKVQAEAAVHVARKSGDRVPGTLLAILAASREATRELRATLEVLRDDDGLPHGLDHVPQLVRRARTERLDATLTIEGRPGEVPPSVDRTAYRIVQEALTNVSRHAAAATASVCITYRPDTVAIRVDDDGRALPGAAAVPGVGLTGMRERVLALGGRFQAGPRREGGFTVRAELPVDGSA
jgi:signal transduction histidine kinase